MKASVHRTVRGQRSAIHGNPVHDIRLPSNGDAAHRAVVTHQARRPGQTHDQFSSAHVRQEAKLVDRRDVLHILGVALGRDRSCYALALARDFKRIEPIDGRCELDPERVQPTQLDLHCFPNRFQPDVGNRDLVGSGRQLAQHEPAVGIGHRGHTAAGDGHARARELPAGCRVGDGARDNPAGSRLREHRKSEQQAHQN